MLGTASSDDVRDGHVSPGLSQLARIGSILVGAGLIDFVVFADVIARGVLHGRGVNVMHLCITAACLISAILGGTYLSHR
jgi:hypothetical protein